MPAVDLDDPAIIALGDRLLAMPADHLKQLILTARVEDQRLMERVLQHRIASGWRVGPAEMMHHLTGGSYKVYRYVKLLSDKIVDAVEGRDVRQLWNLPSQLGKTSILMASVIWTLDLHPEWRIMYVTYDADKATREAGEALDIARQHGHELGFTLRKDIQARGRWNTEQGGGLYATGVGGGIIGYPAEMVLGDDLIKGWVAAHSPITRDNTWRVYQSQMRMRLQASTNPIILCGTRWHEDDPTGRALADNQVGGVDVQDWTLVRLPAIAEEPDPKSVAAVYLTPDPLGRQPGEVIEPLRFTEEETRARARVLGSYLAAGLEQQRPSPEEGGELKRGWWKVGTTLPPKCDAWASSWDMKLKEKESGDFVAGQVWGRVGGDFYLYEAIRGQWNQATARAAVALLQVRHPKCRRHLIETGGYGPEVMDNLRKGIKGYVLSDDVVGALGITTVERPKVQGLLRKGMSGIVGVKPIGSKIVRARAVSPILEGGQVHVRDGDPGALQLINEAAEFPNGVHDDAVDSWSQALSKMSTGSMSVSKPKPKGATPAARTPGPTRSGPASKPTGQVKPSAGRRRATGVSRPTGRRSPTRR